MISDEGEDQNTITNNHFETIEMFPNALYNSVE